MHKLGWPMFGFNFLHFITVMPLYGYSKNAMNLKHKSFSSFEFNENDITIYLIWSSFIGVLLTFLCHKAIQRKKDTPVIAFITFTVSVIQIVLLFVLLFECNN